MGLGRLAIAAAAAVALSVGLSAPARADDSPTTVFELQYRRHISAECDPAFHAAERMAAANGDITAAQAHDATRTFLDCARGPLPNQEHRNRYILFAGASELIAAEHESGDEAVRSRHNAVTLLTPISQRFFEFFDVSYVDAVGPNGTSGVVASVRDDGTAERRITPSRFATLSSTLLAQAQAELAKTP